MKLNYKPMNAIFEWLKQIIYNKLTKPLSGYNKLQGVLILLISVVTISSLSAQNRPFITRWLTATNQLRFDVTVADNVNYTWQELSGSNRSGNGTISKGESNVTITNMPENGGLIRLQLEPANLRAFKVNNDGSSVLIDVNQWGDVAWASMESAFEASTSLQIAASDVPNLTGVSSMSAMFKNCFSLTGPSNIGTWNTANVTNMSDMFSGAKKFNQNISTWNTAKVTNMSFMFDDASVFNQNIGGWNTGAVTDMTAMFMRASAFNQNIGEWNTGAVTTMSGMFKNTSAFNQDIGTWNTANVTDMSYMFAESNAFNQNINAWNTANVTDMSYLFYNNASFNKSIATWNMVSVIYTHSMFFGAKAFNQNVSDWNMTNTEYMQLMFYGATAFNQNLGKWRLAKVITLEELLTNSGMDCANYSATLKGWSSDSLIANNCTLGAKGLRYGNDVLAERTYLINTKKWIIKDDSPSGGNCLTVGILEASTPTLRVFPNPNSGNFTIELAAAGEYVLTNTLGQVIKQISISASSQATQVAGLSEGMYFLIRLNALTNNAVKIVVE